MPGNPIDELPAVDVAYLVEFRYETPETIVRYAAWESDILFSADTFTSLPTMQVKLPKIDGTVRSSNAEIIMNEIDPLDKMRGTFPPVEVTIWELDPDDDTTAALMYRGIIERATYNHNGNPGVVRLRIAGPKKLLETSLSLKIGRFCPWTFGGNRMLPQQGPCDYDREANKETASISAIVGNKITLSGMTTVDRNLWRKGSVRYNGFEIAIHDQINLSNILLIKPAPTHWNSKTVDILPGCDKTSTTCALRVQISVFGGQGIKIPNRDVRTSP